jgi:splicing factor 3B subunit 3
MHLTDKDTVVAGDKFGNVCMLRLPEGVDDNIANPTGDRVLWESGHLHGASQKAEQVASFHVGGVVTSLQKAALPGGQECILYSTVTGK